MALTAPGRSNSTDGPNGGLQDVTFRPAIGGMISETSTKKEGKMGPDYRRETAVHPSIGHAVRHLKSLFGGEERTGKKKSMGKEHTKEREHSMRKK